MTDRDAFPVVVHVVLWRRGRLFLLRRAHTGFMDGFYALPGGHQHRGENVTGAAVRECREEVGIQPLDLTPVCVMPYRSGGHQGLNFIFECSRWSGEPCVNEPDLFDACEWSHPEALPQPHPAWLPQVLQFREEGRWYAEFEWD
jgi:8-oxo-dGTP diphosphatase